MQRRIDFDYSRTNVILVVLHEVPGYLEPLDLELVLLLSVAAPGVAVMITYPVSCTVQ